MTHEQAMNDDFQVPNHVKLSGDYQELNKIILGDCKAMLQNFPDNFFDSMVTDPPYGIQFMNKKWDYDIPAIGTWQEILRVLKPGAHILVACGTRTQHRMACTIEDAGFEIRDVITWHYGSGFPKSRDISKDIDEKFGAEREVVGVRKHPTLKDPEKMIEYKSAVHHNGKVWNREWDITEPATDQAKQWAGWGTGLKPATEFWTLARKPISEKNIADNILKYGTGGLNIDACRIEFKNDQDKDSATWGRGTDILGGNYVGATHGNGKENIEPNDLGRFPANLILDEHAAAILDEQTGPLQSGSGNTRTKDGSFIEHSGLGKAGDVQVSYGDIGGASRFFYCAKASDQEKNRGLEKIEAVPFAASNQAKAELKRGNMNYENDGEGKTTWSDVKMMKNNHPTVKPVTLMRWLVKLITPKGGALLDPFAGSGTTCIAAKLELINYIGIELDPRYVEIAEARIAKWNPEKYLVQTLF